METMNDFVALIRKRNPGMRDADLARMLRITRQAISQMKSGRSKHFSDETAYNIAEVLGLDPAYVLLCLAAERSGDERVKHTWQRINRFFKHTAGRAAAIALVTSLSFFALPQPVEAGQKSFNITNGIHIIRRWLRLFLGQSSGYAV